MQDFESLGLSLAMVDNLKKMSIEVPTEIQQRAIPYLLENNTDLIGLAQTGTGKTAAFGLPLIELCDDSLDATQYLVVAPTRELVQQIAGQLENFGKPKRRLNVQSVFGGASISNQIKDYKRNTPKVLVATPGRLIDLLDRKVVKIDQVRTVVLDEADEMLNMGFQEDIYKILSFTPETKTTWLFSATMPKEVKKISDKFMKSPMEISVDTSQKVNVNIDHKYCVIKVSDKVSAIKRLSDFNPDLYGVVFCRTRMDTQRVADDLIADGYPAESLHGDLSQQQRDRVMSKFRNKKIPLLVATDVAARGIDVTDLTHVIHHSLPDDDAFYTHRSGRTARAGKKGVSYVLVAPHDTKKLQYLGQKLKIEFEKDLLPTGKEIRKQKVNAWVDHLLKVEPVSDVSTEDFENIKSKFEDLSKDEILAKIIHFELHKTEALAGNHGDINQDERSSGRRERGERSERGERGERSERGGERRERGDRSERGERGGERARPGFDKFFINIGRVDGLKRKDLVDFIANTAGIRPSMVGDISVQQKCTFFEVDSSGSSEVEKKLNGIDLQGRSIRVNLETDGGGGGGSRKPFRSSGGSGGYKGNRDGGGGSSHRGGGGGGNRPRRSDSGRRD
ncbi:MAG: ATP-dependent RNA helicase DeaD [Sphingobacteriales bacterium]|jgi:ATP-dependent RNA helicase DeaD